MGPSLNPRIGHVDLKMFAEGRLSWILFYYITLSCAMKQYQELGYVSSPLVFVAVAHWLYANAIMKGEVSVFVALGGLELNGTRVISNICVDMYVCIDME